MRKKKLICGKEPKQLNFNLNEPPIKTANDLNRHLSLISQRYLPLNPERISSQTSEDNLPIITKSEITNKIQKLKRTSICPVDIPIALVKAFSDKISELALP